MNGACATLARVTDVEPTGTTSRQADDAPSPRTDPPIGFMPEDLARAAGGELVGRGSRPILGAAVDSRIVEPGQLFVALPGEHTDGHHFVGDAVARGAAALLVERLPASSFADVTVVKVDGALAALQRVASAWRRRFDPLVVGVTGSIAKTSTKEAVAAVLAARWKTLKNEGNLNNEIGLPLTVLRLRPEHQAAVLEMGMYVGGEIRDLARIGQPRIGVVTAVQPVHLSRIGTIDAVERAKGELVEALPDAADGGVAVLNADDERVRRMRSRTRGRTITYGFADDADVRATDVESRGLDGMAFALHGAGGDRQVAIPTLGRLSVHNALAAAAVGRAAGLTPAEIDAGLMAGWSAPHRASVVRAGGVTIVDDSYNASPASVRAAVELLGGLPGRRIAVLGPMLELGEESETAHRITGAAIAPVLDLVVVIGDDADARALAHGARDATATLAARSRPAALDLLADRLRPGDVVLVKASRGIALDLLVDDLVAALGGPDG